MKETTYRRIGAVDLTCRLIEELAGQREAVGAGEIARAVNAPAGTVACHLATLEDHNFVRRVGDGWQLGMALALFWARTTSSLEAARDRIDRDLATLHIEEDAP